VEADTPALEGRSERAHGKDVTTRSGEEPALTEPTDEFVDAELRDQPTDLPGLFSEHGELSVYDADE
jgi:hypothetical protein